MTMDKTIQYFIDLFEKVKELIKRKSEAIWNEKQKRWCCKVQKDGTRKSFYSFEAGRKGKHIAETKADEWLSTGSEDMRIDKAWDIFISDQKQRISAGGIIKHDQYWRLYISPTLKNKKMSTVTIANWQACIDSGAQKGLSYRSCENIRATITSFLRYAYRSRWSVIRVEDGDLQIPKTAVPSAEKTVLQPDQIRLLFSDPYIVHYGKRKLSPYSYAWQFLIATGLRRGELAGLRTEDIDDNLLTIRRSINTLGEITSGKNDNARRTIELTDIAQSILKEQRKYLIRQGIISPWVFPDQYGERPDPNAIYDHWRTWREQHNITCSLHELRHTYVSINKSMPLELMKATVGHSTSMDTYGIYGHDVDGDRHKAALIADETLSKILSKK